MKKNLLASLGLFLLIPFLSKAQTVTPTWADDIAIILYRNCATCHHPGGLAPNSLMTYTEAYNYAYLINSYVSSQKMPPWPPDPTYKHLANERILSASDKTKISNWVLGGAPQGNPNNAPTPPTFTNNSSALSQIDFTAKMPDYTVNTGQDLYRCFVLNTNFASDQFAAEVEVRPGNPSIVHHVLVFEDTAQAVVNSDNNDPGPGYTSFFGTGSNTSRLVGEWVPGTSAVKFPTGMGVRLRKNTHIIIQIHYPQGTYMKLDSTRVNIKFAPGSPREVYIIPVLTESNITNGPFSIPANSVKTFKQQYTAPYPIMYTILSVAPHMHLIGKQYKVYAVGNVNNDTIPFIYIPNWDFKWQGVYNFSNPMKFDGANYKIYGETMYDNTTNNPNNPNNPPITVNQGESTTDEMMQCYAALLLYQTGDENISQETANTIGMQEYKNDIVKTVQLYNVFPNPAKNQSQLSYFSPENMDVKAKIMSVDGKLVRDWNVSLQSGFGKMDMNIDGLSKGQYFIKVEAKTYTKSISFIVYE
jgi:hypothetical protein